MRASYAFLTACLSFATKEIEMNQTRLGRNHWKCDAAAKLCLHRMVIADGGENFQPTTDGHRWNTSVVDGVSRIIEVTTVTGHEFRIKYHNIKYVFYGSNKLKLIRFQAIL